MCDTVCCCTKPTQRKDLSVGRAEIVAFKALNGTHMHTAVVLMLLMTQSLKSLNRWYTIMPQ